MQVQPPVKPLAVKSKAAKPGHSSQKAPEYLPSIPEQDLLRALYAHQQAQTIRNSANGSNANTDAATTEMHIEDDAEQAGALDSGLPCSLSREHK